MLVSTVVVLVTGHGMLLIPTPRNALDRDLDMFANGSWPSTTDGCDCANPDGGCDAFAARRSGQCCNAAWQQESQKRPISRSKD